MFDFFINEIQHEVENGTLFFPASHQNSMEETRSREGREARRNGKLSHIAAYILYELYILMQNAASNVHALLARHIFRVYNN